MMAFAGVFVTGEQIRAGRALARIEQTQLASAAGLSLETIKRLERIRGQVDANTRTLAAILDAFARIGVVFDYTREAGVGVRRAAAPAAAEPPAIQERRRGAESLHRIIYASTATGAFAADPEGAVRSILNTAIARNQLAGITGALLACDGRFLQAFEGERDAVLRLYGAIAADPRHASLHLIQNKAVATRHFADWAMRAGVLAADDPMIVEALGVCDGFRPERLTPAAALGLLSMLRENDSKLVVTAMARSFEADSRMAG